MPEGIEWLDSLKSLKDKKIICLVDGEHYPPVTEWAVKTIEARGGKIAGLVFAGGTEKIDTTTNMNIFSRSCPVYSMDGKQADLPSLLKRAVTEHHPDLFIDLSDMPVMDFRKRFKVASLLLNRGITYAGSDFIFTPPAESDILTKPSITIQGTGKRIGKTAVSITLARILKEQGIAPAVVAMGRGGPAEPQVVYGNDVKITPEYLLEVAQKGDHAASDYWENALLSGITAIGCRRCGGGLAGNPFISNVAEGARLANGLQADLIIMEGSGPTLPPVKTGSKIIVIGANQSIDEVTSHFNEYRLLSADLAIVTMCESPMASASKVRDIESAIRSINPEIETALTVFRPEPLGNIKDRKVFLATTSPAKVVAGQIDYLEDKFSCIVSGYSCRLSDRKHLQKDLEKINLADVLLTELKAASVDMAAKTARQYDKDIVFLHNRIMLTGGTVTDLKKAVREICDKAGLNRASIPAKQVTAKR